jgi:putative inorganic carbon (hco3(-)) transporter
MFKFILWIFVVVCVTALPFLTADVFQPEVYLFYTLFSIILSCFAFSAKSYITDRNILIPLFLWLFIVLYTSVYAIHAQAAFDSMGNLLVCVLSFIVLSGLDIKKKQQLALALVVGSFFISMRALLQYFLFFDKILPFLASQNLVLTEKEFFYISDIVQRQRVVSTFVSPNLLASYLVMINIIILPFWIAQKKKYLRFALFLLLMMNCYTLWLTRSIAGLLSYVLGVFLFATLFSAKDKTKSKQFKQPLILLIGGLFVLFAALFINRLIFIKGTDNIFLSFNGRLDFWTAALRIIADRPLHFAGLGGFSFFYRFYAPNASFESLMAHNILLQLWIETGLYGLLGFIWFLSALFSNGMKSLLKQKLYFEFYIFKLAVFAGIAAFLFHNMLDFAFFVPQTAIIWWILCAFLTERKDRKNIKT